MVPYRTRGNVYNLVCAWKHSHALSSKNIILLLMFVPSRTGSSACKQELAYSLAHTHRETSPNGAIPHLRERLQLRLCLETLPHWQQCL
jgi:hypothetical protein